MDRNIRILVTGASGFLGAALFEDLYRKGYEVRGLARKSSSLWRVPNNLQSFIFQEATENWNDFIEEFKPEILVCLNWGGVASEDRSDATIQKSSAEAIYSLAKYSQRVGVKRFICIGSQAESAPSDIEIPEIPIATGTTQYAKFKIALFSWLDDLFTEKRNLTWVRVFSIYGPQDHPDTLISQLLRSKILDIPHVTARPEVYWSYLFIDDFCSAMEAIINSPELNGVVNLGNSQLYSLGEVSDKVFEVSKGIYDGVHWGYYPDMGKLKGIGWKPRVSLNEGLKRSEDWLRSQLDANPTDILGIHREQPLNK